MSGLEDGMKQGDKDVEVSVRCAVCGEPVKANESHNCKGEGKKDENTDKT